MVSTAYLAPASWLHRLGLAGAVALAAVLRMHHFAEPSLWLDEYATSWAVAADTFSGMVRRCLSLDTQSIFYSFWVKLARDSFGNTPFALRLPSVVFGIATVAAAYPLALAVLRSRQAALFCTLAFAVNPELIFVSQDARSYAPALFCTVVSFRAFLALIEDDTLARRAVYVLATIGAYYSHTLFGFIVAIQVAHLVVLRRWRWASDRRWWISGLALALLAAPTAAQIVSLFGRRFELDWIGTQTWQFPLKVFADLLSPKAFVLTAVWIVLTGIAPSVSSVARDDRGRLLLVWFLLPLVCFAVIPPFLGTQLIFPRYVLFVLPAALLITAKLVLAAPRGPRRQVAAGIYLGAMLAFHSLPLVQSTGTFAPKNEGGWDAAARFLEERAGPRDLVLFASGFIEADRAASPQVTAEFRSYLDWPLMLHVAPERAAHVRSLPARVSDATFPYVQGLLNEAASEPRVWLVGDRFIVREISRPFAAESSRLRQVQEKHFGKAAVVELRQAGSIDP